MLNRPVIKAIRIPFQGSSEINLYDENIKKLLLSSRDYLEYCSAVLFDSFQMDMEEVGKALIGVILILLINFLAIIGF